MVPMTLISFIVVRPPACFGVAITPMCTTVSTTGLPMNLGDHRVANVGRNELVREWAY